MMPRSFESRLTLLLQGLAALVIAAFALSALGITRATLYREESHALDGTARRMAASLDLEFAEEHDLRKAVAAVLSEEADAGLFVRFEDAQGHTLAMRPAPRAGVAAVSLAGMHRARVRSHCGAWVEVAVSDRVRSASLTALARALALAAAPLLLLMFALSRWTVRRALRPLQQMTERATDLSLGDGTRSLGGDDGLAELDRLRVAFDRLLARLDDQLRAERQFSSDASHELRTPLTVLGGEIELARAQAGTGAATRESLDRAAGQVRAMRELVEALMLMRRASEGPAQIRQAFEAVDLSDVVESARHDVGLRYPERRGDIGVEASLDVVTSGHPVLLVAGVRNLLDNALKFTSATTPVHVTVTQDERWACVCVEDGGRGIDVADTERVFDPFFRGTEARAESSGFGLGLPILRRVARVHGGDVLVERSSRLGGARFTLQLPRWRAQRAV